MRRLSGYLHRRTTHFIVILQSKLLSVNTARTSRAHSLVSSYDLKSNQRQTGSATENCKSIRSLLSVWSATNYDCKFNFMLSYSHWIYTMSTTNPATDSVIHTVVEFVHYCHITLSPIYVLPCKESNQMDFLFSPEGGSTPGHKTGYSFQPSSSGPDTIQSFTSISNSSCACWSSKCIWKHTAYELSCNYTAYMYVEYSNYATTFAGRPLSVTSVVCDCYHSQRTYFVKMF